jgi:hypothetical protein
MGLAATNIRVTLGRREGGFVTTPEARLDEILTRLPVGSVESWA